MQCSLARKVRRGYAASLEVLFGVRFDFSVAGVMRTGDDGVRQAGRDLAGEAVKAPPTLNTALAESSAEDQRSPLSRRRGHVVLLDAPPSFAQHIVEAPNA
jgi:hypothetical protein